MASSFNTKEYAWVDVTIVCLGRTLPEGRGIEYKVKHQKEVLFAAGNKGRGIQKGKKEYDGTLTILQSGIIAMDRAAKEKGYEDITDIDFDIVVSYSANGIVTTDRVVGASITEIPRALKEGDLNMEIALPFIALDVESNVI